MRTLFRWIRNLLLFGIVIAIAVTIWLNIGSKQIYDKTAASTEQDNGISYSLEDNALFKNIPLNQVRNVFKLMNKQEFMAVSGLSRMGYNDDYLAGQRGDEFILYHFGEKNVTVFQSEEELQQEIQSLGQNINLQDKSAF